MKGDFFKCDDCGEIFVEEELLPAKDLNQRISPGGIYTPYECPDPECGDLCYPTEAGEDPYCEVEGCPSPADGKVGVSEESVNDSYRFMCGACEDLFMMGVQHGRMVQAEMLGGKESLRLPIPGPPFTRKPFFRKT